MNLTKKETHLISILKNMEQVIIAFSGGVDSTYLAAMAYQVLGNKAVAVTLQTEYIPAREIDEAKKLADLVGIKKKIVKINALENIKITDNPPDRCFYCKADLFTHLKNIAKELNIGNIIEGSNIDDLKDYRPGLQALINLNIKSPLKDAGLTKEEIRVLSKKLNLPTWNKPSFSCLAARFPYGNKITQEKIKQLETAENYLLKLGFEQFRVRHHDNIARIEVLPDYFKQIIEFHDEIVKQFKELGFAYITLDLQGYRSGSLNEVFKKAE